MKTLNTSREEKTEKLPLLQNNGISVNCNIEDLKQRVVDSWANWKKSREPLRSSYQL